MDKFITLRAAAGTFRVAQFQEREHLVVPIIALVEGVIHASNASAPELVPADTISIAPSNWNGRPVVVDHPEVNGEMVSASSSPDLLEASIVGYIFNARAEAGRLKMEAWIDVDRATALGGKALEMVERIRAKASDIEVSVGAIVSAIKQQGSFNGKPYYAVWSDLRPDHLALLSAGSTGACSNGMGCGVRAAKATETPTMITGDRSILMRLFSVLRPAAKKTEQNESDRARMNKLYDALRAVEPGFLGLDDTFSEDGIVIYSTMPEDKVMTYRRSFTMAEDGSVTLGEAEEVEAVMRYEPVKAAAAPASCGCGGAAHPAPTTLSATSEGDPVMKQKAERIAALIANTKTPFTEAHRALLENATDDQLTAFEQHADKADETAATTTPAPAATTPAATTTTDAPVTLEALVEKADPDIRAAFHSIREQSAKDKADAIAALKATGRCAFTDAELAGKALAELKALVALASAPAPAASTSGVSFAGRGVARQEAAADAKTVDRAPSLAEKFRAAKS